MTASIINKTFKSIVAASAALIMAASVAACGPSAATPSDEAPRVAVQFQQQRHRPHSG